MHKSDPLLAKLERALGPELVAKQKAWDERYEREHWFSWSFNGCWDELHTATEETHGGQ